MPVGTPELAFQVDTGRLFWEGREITGLASRDMVDAAAFDVSVTLNSRIDALEAEVHELRQLRNAFTASLARELISRCERFVNNRELTGMTDEEFETEISNLLFSGGV